MFGRIFGRGKDEPEQAVCAKCGRTLLAGEWTRRVTGPDGENRLLCSLCGPDLPLDQDEPPETTWTPANNGRVRETRQDAVAKTGAEEPETQVVDKDAVIASLQERLARGEARNQELTRELARLREAVGEPGGDAQAAETALVGEAAAQETTMDSSEPGERTWGETPAEFAAAFAAAEAAGEGGGEAEPEADEEGVSPAISEDTQPLPVVESEDAEVVAAETSRADAAEAAALEGEVAPVEAAALESAAAVGAPAAAADELAAAVDESTAPDAVELASPDADVEASGGESYAVVEDEQEPEPAPANAEAEVAALALLQRGVDLFNVSRVPRKIAETNEQLGMPSVHAAPDEPVVALTFMWSMGWYRFVVDADTGDVQLADRGYEEITDLPANAGVRADGSVQLAPAQISRAAAQRIQQEDQPAARPDERQGGPEPPSVAAQKPPEILSKSLLGQRSDDKPAAWEKTQARDFDWDR